MVNIRIRVICREKKDSRERSKLFCVCYSVHDLPEPKVLLRSMNGVICESALSLNSRFSISLLVITCLNRYISL